MERKFKVLIVDDEPDLRKLLTRAFVRAGCETQEAGSGNEALELVKSGGFDVVVSDIRMPNGNGIELLNAIKKLDVDQPTVMFMSGYTDLSIEEVYDLGAEAIFAKPFNQRQVVADVIGLIMRKTDKFSVKIENSQLTISSTAKNLDAIFNDENLRFGRGGVTFLNQSQTLQVGDSVSHKVELTEEVADKLLEIQSLVRWVAKQEDRRVFGTEIYFVSEKSRDRFTKKISQLNTVCWIPKRV